MKAIKMRIQKHSRPLVILLAAVVVILTSMVVANATQTITTPNAVNIPYSLATGTGSATITPASNRSVLVMGCCTTPAFQGVGQVTLIRIPSTLIFWTGLESATMTNGGSAITSGFNSTSGTHIVWIDVGHFVDIQTAGADAIVIENNSGGNRAGNVTLVW